MSRILLATLGSLGDLHPYIAVGTALRARGQHVRLATSIDYRSRVEAAGQDLLFARDNLAPDDAAVLLDSGELAQAAGKPDEARKYLERGLKLYPNLQFELLDVMWGLSSIVVCYKNQKGTRTAEFMEFGENGKIIRVVANYSG